MSCLPKAVAYDLIFGNFYSGLELPKNSSHPRSSDSINYIKLKKVGCSVNYSICLS